MKNFHRIHFAGFGSAGASLLLAASLLVPTHSFATTAAGFETPNPKVEILEDSISIEHFSGASGGIADSGSINVPEPTAAALVLGSLLLLSPRRRR